MPRKSLLIIFVILSFAGWRLLSAATPPESPFRFELKAIPFILENDETAARNAPETMPGGVAVFDYNGDGRPDIWTSVPDAGSWPWTSPRTSPR